jgi:hypothetical protein
MTAGALLGRYVLEALALELGAEPEAEPETRDCNWRALDVALVVAAGCGGPRLVRRARRVLLSRLLASLVNRDHDLPSSSAKLYLGRRALFPIGALLVSSRQ